MTIVNTYDDLKLELNACNYQYDYLNDLSDDKLENLGYRYDIMLKCYYDDIVEKIIVTASRELDKVGFIYDCFDNSNVLEDIFKFAFKDFDITNSSRFEIILDVLNENFKGVVLDNNDKIFYTDKQRAYKEYIASCDFSKEQKDNIKYAFNL